MFRKKSEEEKHRKHSYSQSGEDMIVEFIFRLLRVDLPTYLDIGAHQPYFLSNTALFYLKGSKGVSVEPDPNLYAAIRKERPREITLNVGVSEGGSGEADFYIMNVPTLNTFSADEARRYSNYSGKSIERIVKIRLLNVNEIIRQYFDGKTPDFVSVDVEGMDLAIVRSFDFDKYRPAVFCIETLTYTENNTEEKLEDIIRYMQSQGYLLYADTYINSIFVEASRWKNR